MKKKITSLMTTLILNVFFSISASAYDVEVDGIYYNLIEKAKQAEVTSGEQLYSKDVAIPSSISVNDVDYSVTSIGGDAFSGCISLTSIAIPNSVTNIGSLVFYGCTNLTSITIPNSVTNIGKSTFANCTSLTAITIPNSVSSIEDCTFSCCTSLTSITIPNSVTSIGDRAFYECTSLTSITIPNSVTNIEGSAFSGCTNLTSITIPNSITIIQGWAFYGCTSLSSITIPNSVTRIESYAFSGCSSLTSITIPNSMTNIESWAFKGCKNLETVFCYAEKVPSTNTDTFKDSYIEYATLYVPESSINIYQSTEPWNGFGTIKSIEGSGMKTVKDRGIAIQSSGGFINISGLDNNEKVDFYGVDGKALGSAKSIDGSVSFSAKQGTVIVAKIGKESVKIAVE